MTRLFIALIIFTIVLFGYATLNGTAFASTTATSCATVNNTTNRAVWVNVNTGARHTATYRDLGKLVWSHPVPASVHAAAAKLTIGAPGPKVRRACR